jgi:formate hydrogenlyase transcriptional activator
MSTAFRNIAGITDPLSLGAQHGEFQFPVDVLSLRTRPQLGPSSIADDSDNAGLLQEKLRSKLLLELAWEAVSNQDINELVSAMMRRIKSATGSDGVCIFVVGPKENELDVYSLDCQLGTGTFKHTTQTPFADTIATYVLRSGKHWAGTREQLSATFSNELLLTEKFGVGCMLPLSSHHRIVGALGLVRMAHHPYSKDELYFLNGVCTQVALALENALAYREISELKDKLAQEKLYLEQEIRSELKFDQIVGDSRALRQVLELVETVAPSDSTVLLLGETGTGKELIARAIHDHSRRKNHTFVKLNCAAIPTGLLESELFGHEKGAFTGAIGQKIGRLELADQGTLFLDEVGDVPLEIQPKLLRALQEREFERLGSTRTKKVDLRLVAATNRDLEKMIADREFRSDLFYRLNVFPIRIPPLRERREDIPVLARYFTQNFARQMEKPIETIPAATMKALTECDWPGNVRELANFIERAVILTRSKSLEAPLAELRRVPTDQKTQSERSHDHDEIARIVKETLHALDGKKGITDEYANKQREEIRRALTECQGRVGGEHGAAERLGMNRTTLLSRMKKLRINAKQFSLTSHLQH